MPNGNNIHAATTDTPKVDRTRKSEELSLLSRKGLKENNGITQTCGTLNVFVDSNSISACF